MKAFITPIIILISLGLFFSCGSKKENRSTYSDEFNAAKAQIADDISTVLQDIPAPSEVPYLLMSIGADYNSDLINEPGNIDRYTSDMIKTAVNLGVFTADIAYLSAYDKSQEALDCVNATKTLAQTLGLGTVMDLKMISRFESNLGNEDSLKLIINDMMDRNRERLQSMNRLNVAGLVLSGAFIEGLYIATSVIDSYPEDLPKDVRNLILEPLIKMVLDQANSVDDMLKVLEDFPEDRDLMRMKSELRKIKVIYDNELEEVSSQITENKGGLVLSSTVLQSLHEELTRIRQNLVS